MALDPLSPVSYKKRPHGRFLSILIALRKILFLYNFYRHIFSGPKLKGSSSLVQKHIHTITGSASRLLCFTEQPGFFWIIDYIKYKEILVEHGGICNDSSVCVRCQFLRKYRLPGSRCRDRCTENLRIFIIVKCHFTFCTLI